MDTTAVTALAGTFSLMTFIAMQLLKPWIEAIPWIMVPSRNAIHDSILRTVQYIINLALLIAAYHTKPEIYGGLEWWGVAAIALGQSSISHLAYTVGKAGGATTDRGQPVATLNFQSTLNTAPAAKVSDFPTVPR